MGFYYRDYLQKSDIISMNDKKFYFKSILNLPYPLRYTFSFNHDYDECILLKLWQIQIRDKLTKTLPFVL